MRLVLSGENARILSKAIKSFARISPELFIEAENNCLTLRGVNQSKSAYAVMVFDLPFFLLFEVDSKSTNEYENNCKVLMKTCLSVFKNMHTVEECTITLDATAFKLIIIFKCRPKVVKTHSLSLLRNEYLRFGQTSNSVNCIIASHKIFHQIIQNFKSIDEEITYEVKKGDNKITVKNYIEGAHLDVRYMRSKVTLNSNEFDCYQISDDTTLTFCQRELRAILNFASALNLNVTMKFTTAGSPVVFLLETSQSVSAHLVISTLSPDAVNNCNNTSIHETNRQTKTKETKAPQKRPHKIATNSIKEPPIRANIPNAGNKTQIMPHIIDLNDDDDDDDLFNSPTIFNFNKPKDSDSIVPIDKSIMNLNKTNTSKQKENEINVPQSKSPKTQETVCPSNLRPTLVPIVPLQSEDIEVIFREESEISNVNIFEDSIPASPENLEKSRKIKHIFRRCYEPTFDPRKIPGASQILAENSDTE